MIIDASVGSKWILKGESYEKEANLLLNFHIEGKDKITVPDLFFYEIANTCATKTTFTKEMIEDSLNVISKAQLLVYHPQDSEVLQSAVFAKEYKLSVYDMLYAVIAKKHKTVLITADEKFVQKTKFPFVKLLSEI